MQPDPMLTLAVNNVGAALAARASDPGYTEFLATIEPEAAAAARHAFPADRDEEQQLAPKLVGLINREIARRMWTECFFEPKSGKIFHLNPEGQLVETTSTNYIGRDGDNTFGSLVLMDRWIAILKDYSEPVAARAAVDEALKAMSKGCKEQLLSHIRLYRQATAAIFDIDIFATAPAVSLKDKIATVRLVDRTTFNHPKSKPNPALVDKYIAEQFPELDEFIDFVVAARFAASRREAFTWLHAASNWGKNFLVEAFDRLGLVFRLTLKEMVKAMSGDPVGVDPNEGLGRWVMVCDEFKAVTAELKELNEDIRIAAKNQMRVRVPLYLKLFMSAEAVKSLTGEGIESQFNNRMCYFAPRFGGLRLDRLYDEHATNLEYLDALTVHIADAMTAKVAVYLALGREQANHEANRVIRKFRAGRLLSDEHGSLDDRIAEIAAELREVIKEWADWKQRVEGTPYPERLRLAPQFAARLSMQAKLGFCAPDPKTGNRRQPVVLLKDAPVVIADWIRATADPGLEKKLAYKVDEIAGRLTDVPREAQGRTRLYWTADALAGEQVRGRAMWLRF